MNSAQNRCAFVRAEYVQILILLLQRTGSYRLPLPELSAEEEQDACHTVNGVTEDDSFAVASDTVEHFLSSDLRCLDEAVNNEMQLLLESDGVEMQCNAEVRIGRLANRLHTGYLLLVSIL